ncbi:TlpA family protein disulfide reductase [Nonomuraea sp. SYSU D8015]|uniref:TlpA family protein disulfide reductase n=1 Tax=Nonomuraea sp. SYSU D8015 TaxID=2593644 RepID=UPI0016606384|nr:redoxin domain-containing protein [Nonomuraea sp. SYSU D8015]
MAVVWAALILVGAICVLDLILTLGVIRRLREHTTHLETLLRAGTGALAAPGLPAVGGTVGEFAARTLDGEEVSRRSLSGETLVAFFSPGCKPCLEKLPGFLEHARRRIGGRRLILAIVAGGDAAAAEMTETLRQVARVIVEDGYDGPVAQAFGVSEYPAFCLVDSDGTIVAAEGDVVRLALPADR